MVQEYRAKGAPPRTPDSGRGSDAGGRFKHVFHGPPITAPGGAVPFMVPEEIAEDLSRHLDRLAVYTRDELVALAGPGGMLDVAALAGPRIRQDPPVSGPRSWHNPGQWVPVSAPVPAARVVEPPDMTAMSDEQAEAARLDAEAVLEGERRRRVWKARLAEADPGVGER